MAGSVFLYVETGFHNIIGNPIVNEQTRKIGQSSQQSKKQSAAKRIKAKQANSPTKTTKAAPAESSGGMFEGSLLYRSDEYHNNLVRRFSYGRAYNGPRTTIVTVKGTAVHILDEPMHLHTIVNLSDNVVYLYSDLTKQGLKGSTKDLEGFINIYDPEYQIDGQKKVSTLNMTSEKAVLDNKKYGIFKGEVTIGDENRLDVEMWLWDKFKISKAYNYMFFGIPVPGIVRKGIYSQIGSVPLLGKMKSVVAMELVAYSRCNVKTSEMLPPSYISIENYTDVKQLTQMYKENRKQLKKLKLNPESKSKKETMRNIRDRWDFADEWLKKPVSTANNDIAWQTINNSLLELANAFAGTEGKQATDYHQGDIQLDNDISDSEYIDKDMSDAEYIGNDISDSEYTDDDKLDPQAKREREERNQERKQREFAARHERVSTRTYSSYADKISNIRTQRSMRGESFERKKRDVKSYQEKMKQIRERYESGAGKKLPGANEQLERWSPSRSDLMEKCSACGGDGKCGNCSRRGNGKCSSCGGTGNVGRSKDHLSCPNCQHPGNGKCASCDGRGKCHKCNGKGEF